MKKHFAYAAGLSVALFSIASAQEFQGASALFKRLAEIPKGAPADPQTGNPVVKLSADLKKFQDEAATLTPQDAATRWLALADQFVAINRQDSSPLFNAAYLAMGERLSFSTLFVALPPPSAWDALAKAIDARPPATGRKQALNDVLHLVSATLLNQPEARWKAAAALRATLEKNGQENATYNLQSLTKALVQSDPDPRHAIAAFEEKLALFEGDSGDTSGDRLEVPDLVTLAGEATAKKLLQRAFLIPRVEIEIERGAATKAIARKVALELAPKLKIPPWSIMNSLDSMALFEAMQKRFPRKEKDDNDARDTAASYYLLALIAANRNAEAVKFVVATEGEAQDRFSPSISALAQAGQQRAVFSFLKDLLSQHPELSSSWNDFIELAPQLGESAQMLTTLRAAMAKPGLSVSARLSLRRSLAPALLAADQIDDGVKELLAVLAAPPQASSDDEDSSGSVSSDQFGPPAWDLVRIGNLLKKPEWIEAGLTAARQAAQKKGASSKLLADLLLYLKRDPEAEAQLIDLAVTASRQESQQRRRFSGGSTLSDALSRLLVLYHEAGRADDVLALLDNAEGWGVRDVRDLAVANAKEYSATFIAATALAAKGRTDEARTLVNADLEKNGGSDPAYALLLKLGGDGVMARLDELASRDHFEERPLIWKAQLQLDVGQLDAAEKTVRAAIAIDPSDGEQPKGDRMRAYAVLAAILEKKGDATQAKTMRGVVEAIRISEDADDWWRAGLITRAVQMYEEGLTHFSDAYCIQSRLALRAADLGQLAKAEEHYRRAYELMPDSFGRVESHCFGCEQAFNGPRAQGIAEKVFTSLAAQPNAKPQVHYLLGYLYDEEERPIDAAESYRRATALDPDYLNAWKKLAGLGDRMRLPPADADAAVLNQIRLDPLKRHSWSDTSGVVDLKALWTEVETAAKLQPKLPETLYPLSASKAALERKMAAAKNSYPDNDFLMGSRFDVMSNRWDRFRSAGELVAGNDVLGAIAGVFESFSEN